jgi:uncharacterized protein
MVIYVDADACPVKQEVYRVAMRFEIKVVLVANSWMHIPDEGEVELVVVKAAFDEADKWIVEKVTSGDVVITSDIPLAGQCLTKGARVLDPKGRAFTDESIGNALADRELMSFLRDTGDITGGSAPYSKKDRSKFLQSLDEMLRRKL